MLPGFRLVLMTIVLAASVLIFGLGAAALLRATHEEFASLPSRRALPPQLPIVIAEQPAEPATTAPTLALLHVAPPPDSEPLAVEPANPPPEATKEAAKEEIITDLATPEPGNPATQEELTIPEPAIASIEVQPTIVEVQPVLIEAPPPLPAIRVAIQPARHLHVRKVVKKKRRVVRRIVQHKPEPQQVPPATTPFPLFGGG